MAADPTYENAPLKCIGFAAVDTDIESLIPTIGEAVTWTADWTVGGAVDDGDDFSIDKDTLDLTDREEGCEIDPPKSQNRLHEYVYKLGLDAFSFVAYSLFESAFSISSHHTSADGYYTVQKAITYKAVVIELYGVGIIYCPKCRVHATGLALAIASGAKRKIKVKVFGTADLPAGWAFFPATAAESSGS